MVVNNSSETFQGAPKTTSSTHFMDKTSGPFR